jgi:hypothetical protein
MRPDYQHLYELREDHGAQGAFRATPEDRVLDHGWDLLYGNMSPTQPVRLDHQMGRYLNDVVWTGLTGIVLASDRMIALLRDGGFTGWQIYPVLLFGKRSENIGGYHGLSVAGRCGPIDWSRSPKEWRGPLVPNGDKLQVHCGLFFKKDEWDGSDIFLARDSAITIVTEHLRQALQHLKMRNVSFERLTESEWRVQG